jgi:hypothetical protein
MVQSAENVALTVQQEAQASKVAWIADVVITYSSMISLNLAPRTKTFLAADNPIIGQARYGDRVYAHRRDPVTLGSAALIGGVMIETAGFVPESGKVEIYHVIPAVGLNQTLTIPLRLVAYRPAGA